MRAVLLLAIDVGNSTCVVALCAVKERRILHRWYLDSRQQHTCDDYGAWLHSLFALHGLSLQAVSAALLSSVVPRTIAPLEEMCHKYLRRDLLVVKREDVPITLHLDSPEQVGIDRALSAFAVCNKFSAPALVVDFGTATTFDVIDAQGRYIGGVIAPGIESARDGLVARAAQLPYVNIQFCEQVLGKDTLSAMQSGLFWGWVSMVDGMCVRLKQAMQAPQTCVVATGGACALVAQASTQITHIEKDLIIHGLIELHSILDQRERSRTPLAS